MGEGEDREDREDLFEDLDKFFAPIQDVDWPEGGEPSPAPPGPPAPPPTAEPPVAEPEALASEFEPVGSLGATAAEPPAPGEPVETEALFAPPAEPVQPAWSESEEEGEGSIEAFLFADEDTEEADLAAAISSERERTPEAYLDLPGGDAEQEE